MVIFVRHCVTLITSVEIFVADLLFDQGLLLFAVLLALSRCLLPVDLTLLNIQLRKVLVPLRARLLVRGTSPLAPRAFLSRSLFSLAFLVLYCRTLIFHIVEF